MRVNYHCHSSYCRHAQGSVEDYVVSAINSKVEILGMSDHAPFPDGFHGNGMDFCELDSYLNDIAEAKQKYEGKIRIYKSLEIEYLPEFRHIKNYYEWLFNHCKMDYLLLGEHFFRDRNGDFHNVYDFHSTDEIYEYALACKEAMETGYFKILAHPDIFGMNEHFVWDDNFSQATEIIIDSALKNNVILEYNANGRRRGQKDYPDGRRYQYPHDRFWKIAAKAGVQVVVGSDCHNPVQMWDEEMDKSHEILKELGIKPLENIF